MSANRLFVPSALLDAWVSAGRVELQGAELRLCDGSGRYALEEAALVLREVTGGGDALRLVGRARPTTELTGLGAEILDRSMVLGDVAYDVEPGFLASPGAPGGKVESRAALAALSALSGGPPKSQSDEELLARYLIEKL